MKRSTNDFSDLDGSGLSEKVYVAKKSFSELSDLEALYDIPDRHLDTVREQRFVLKRFWLLFVCIAFLFIVLAAQLFNLQIIQGQKNREYADGNRIKNKIIRADRGVIYDRNKKVLARNVASYDLNIIPFELPREEEKRMAIYAAISPIIKITVSDIKDQVIEAQKKYFLEPLVLKDNLDRQTALILESKTINMPGVTVERNAVRNYVDKSLSHLLGYVGRINAAEYETRKDDYFMTDYLGKSGIETVYEKQLRGQFGEESIEVDAAGNAKKTLATKEAIAGNSVVLSIDRGLQDVAATELKKSLNGAHGKAGAVVALDPRNGQVLAMLSYPYFDGDLFTKGISSKNYSKLINDKNRPLFNRAISGAYPPGSTIKIVHAAAGLEEKVVTPSTSFYCPGRLSITNIYDPSIVYSFRCWKLAGHGPENVTQALKNSCDVYFYTLGGGYKDFKGLGLARLNKWESKFGLGKLTGIDLPDEVAGLVPNEKWKQENIKESWYTGDTYNLSIGQGYLLTTPLQVASYTMAVANGGTLYTPQVLNSVLDTNGNIVQQFTPKIDAQGIASNDSLGIVRQGMRQAVTEGTAWRLADLPFTSAAKTGTAQFAGSTYGHEHAWFTCFAPYDNPQIVITVLAEASGEGATWSAPVAKAMLQYWMSKKH